MRQASRWSSSSEESMGSTSKISHGTKPRKSGESSRSKITIGTLRSKKSAWSLKSRRSEDGHRPEIGLKAVEVPPVPVWNGDLGSKGVGMGKGAGKGQQTPSTPGRGRRVVEGLARRLGLTPKKKNM